MKKKATLHLNGAYCDIYNPIVKPLTEFLPIDAGPYIGIICDT
jgi:hypothetical protein